MSGFFEISIINAKLVSPENALKNIKIHHQSLTKHIGRRTSTWRRSLNLSNYVYRKKNETTIVGDGDNSSGSFKDVTSASPGPESQAGFGEAGCQNTPPSANGVDVMYQQNGAHMSSAESDKSSNKSGSTNKKKNK